MARLRRGDAGLRPRHARRRRRLDRRRRAHARRGHRPPHDAVRADLRQPRRRRAVTPDGKVVGQARRDTELLWGLRGGGGNRRRHTARVPAPSTRAACRRSSTAGGVRDGLLIFRDLLAGSPRDPQLPGDPRARRVGGADARHRPLPHGHRPGPRSCGVLRLGARGRERRRARAPRSSSSILFDSPYGENRHYWKGHLVDGFPDELVARPARAHRHAGAIARRHPDRVPARAPKDVDPALGAIAYRGAHQRQCDGDVVRPSSTTSTSAGARHRGRDGAVGVRRRVRELHAGRRAARAGAAAFGDEAFARLRTLKTRLDLSNVLRRNQNIPPL